MRVIGTLERAEVLTVLARLLLGDTDFRALAERADRNRLKKDASVPPITEADRPFVERITREFGLTAEARDQQVVARMVAREREQRMAVEEGRERCGLPDQPWARAFLAELIESVRSGERPIMRTWRGQPEEFVVTGKEGVERYDVHPEGPRAGVAHVVVAEQDFDGLCVTTSPGGDAEFIDISRAPTAASLEQLERISRLLTTARVRWLRTTRNVTTIANSRYAVVRVGTA